MPEDLDKHITNQQKKEPEPVVETPPKGNYYLVLIAVSKYNDSNQNLHNARSDAEKLKQLLLTEFGRQIDGGFIGFSEERTKAFYDEEAKGGNISAHLESLTAQMGPDDALLIYFSGHGIPKKEGLRLCLHNFDLADEDTHFDPERLYNKFSDYNILDPNSKCRDVLVILDCCFAGEGMKGLGKSTSRQYARQMMVSAADYQKASDGGIHGSPFLVALLEAFREESRSKFTIEDLYPAVRTKVTIKTKTSQKVDLGNLPGDEAGSGSFWFIRKSDCLDGCLLADTIINKELNFVMQRNVLDNEYDPERGNGRFNVFVGSGMGDDVRQILARIFLNHAFRENKINVFPSKGYKYYPVKIMNAEETVLENVLRSIPNNTEDDFLGAMLSHFKDLFEDESVRDEDCVIIFDINLSDYAVPDMLKAAVQFCVNFHKKFQKILDSLPEEAPFKWQITNRVKLMFFIQEEREGDTPLVVSEWFADLPKDQVNLIYDLNPVTPITRSEVDRWLERAAVITHPDFQNLSIDLLFPDQIKKRNIDELIGELYLNCKIIADDPIKDFFSINKPPVR